MKILAFAGSSSSTSRNKELVSLKRFTKHDINLLDLKDFDMLVFSVDREKNGFPQEAQNFMKAIEDCDFIICSMAEQNRSYNVPFKNI